MTQFKVHQEVYHTRFGRGFIQNITEDDPPIISVDFSGETKDLVCDKNLLLRMTIRESKNVPVVKERNTLTTVSPKDSFFSGLTPPADVEINQGKAPISVTQENGQVVFVCPQCHYSFKKAKRCPECGQLIAYDVASLLKSNRRILHTGDDVSKLRIYEIINKYFGENYNGWMKASYEINDKYWAWFPTIYKENERPGGNYGGTVMWSNVLTQDEKTVISTNFDELNKTPKESKPTKNVLIFARINGTFKFIGVFNDYHDPYAKLLTYRHDRIARGIDLDTFQLIDED